MHTMGDLLRSRLRPALAASVAALVVAIASARTSTAPRAPARAAGAVQSKYLAPAEAAYRHSHAWWDGRRRWYRQFLPSAGKGRSAATMWGIVHLFQAAEALAIANPTHANVAAARRFAAGAERYWNPDLRPVPAYGPVPNNHGPHLRTWYDDESWWGIAFYDAFRATGDRRYLTSAGRALTFLDSGWDKRRGGIYWDNRRTFKASESLAGAMVIAAALYRETHLPRYLALAKKYIAWADSHIRAADGLYGGREDPSGPMPYVEGPMAEAFMLLCKGTGDQSYCRSSEALAAATADRFPKLTMGPQYDSMYIRSMLELYRFDRNPRWYRIASAAGDRAIANASGAGGLYLRTWDGRPITTIGTAPGKLQTHAATTLVLSALAAARPPAAG